MHNLKAEEDSLAASSLFPCHTWNKEIKQESPSHPFIVTYFSNCLEMREINTKR